MKKTLTTPKHRSENNINWQRLFDQAMKSPRRKALVIKRIYGEANTEAVEICSNDLKDYGILKGDFVIWQVNPHVRPEEGDFIVAQTFRGRIVGFYVPATLTSPARIRQGVYSDVIEQVEGIVINLFRELEWKAQRSQES
jgi:hypothetical protein